MTGPRYRCLVHGCRQYDQWLPVHRPGEDERHYLTDHYQPDPTRPQPAGTHPTRITSRRQDSHSPWH